MVSTRACGCGCSRVLHCLRFPFLRWLSGATNHRTHATLEKFPRAGRKVAEFDDENLRELIAYSYRIIYRVETAEVIVAAVIHGKRDLGSV
ncbi:MAG: type II toxin-antitoxin system RelE/ParE family toxin [Terriglobales bacterium]